MKAVVVSCAALKSHTTQPENENASMGREKGVIHDRPGAANIRYFDRRLLLTRTF